MTKSIEAELATAKARIRDLIEENEPLRADRDAHKEQAAEWEARFDELIDEKLSQKSPETLAEARRHEIAAFCEAALAAIQNGTAVERDESGRKWRGLKDVIFNAAQHFDVDERTVQRALKNYRGIRSQDVSLDIEAADIPGTRAWFEKRRRVTAAS